MNDIVRKRNKEIKEFVKQFCKDNPDAQRNGEKFLRIRAKGWINDCIDETNQ